MKRIYHQRFAMGTVSVDVWSPSVPSDPSVCITRLISEGHDDVWVVEDVLDYAAQRKAIQMFDSTVAEQSEIPV